MSKQILIFDKKNPDFINPKVILNKFFNIKQNSVLGGEDTLEFSIPIPMDIFDFNNEDFVLFDNKKYIIKKIKKSKDENGLCYDVNCEGLYTMLIDKTIDPSDGDTWLPGVGFSVVLERILRGTKFTIGKCDDFGEWDIELAEKNCLEAINEAKNIWPKTPEIYFDGYAIYAVAQRGNDTGYQLHYKKNVSSITREVDSTAVCTRYIGLGKDGMTIEGLKVSDSIDTTGAHVENGVITKKYIDAPNINDFATPKELYEDLSDYTDQAQLLEAMQKRITQLYTPTVTYEVTYAEMIRQNVPYSDIQIGDLVWINDPDFGSIKLRVAEMDKDPLNYDNSVVTLGERNKDLADYIADFEAVKSVVDSLAPGEIESKLKAALELARQELNMGTNTCWITEDDGIICADRDTLGYDGQIINTTKLIKMANGSIGCSLDGGQTYKSAMTPYGIMAETIVGGRIDAQHITVGDETDFADGYSPTDIRKPLEVEFDNTKQAINQNISDVSREIPVLNTSIAQTNTAINLLQQDLQDKIDILSMDVSGLNGDYTTMQDMYNAVNDQLFGNSYFRWTAQGIHATDTNNPYNQMLLSSGGIGFSTDGGHIFENAITAKGIVASQVNIGTFGEAPFKGLTIRNGAGEETFAIDTNGNISLMGNINMNGGSINWQNMSKITYDALDPDLRGKYTWIDSNGIYTGTIGTKQLILDGDFEIRKNGQPTFRISHDGEVSVWGNIHMGPGSTIDWETMSKPTAQQIGAATENDLEAFKAMANKRFTKITEDGIYTGEIDAGHIVVTGYKIPANAVDITCNDIGAATKQELANLDASVNRKVQSAAASFSDDMHYQLQNLKSDMVTRQNVTEITNNSIRTATISANQIMGGTLAGVDIYCDNLLCVGSRYSASNPRIEFEPGSNRCLIEYRNRGNGYMAITCADGIALWGSGGIYMQTAMNRVYFSKNGSSSVGSGTYISFGDVVNKINQLCAKAGISKL